MKIHKSPKPYNGPDGLGLLPVGGAAHILGGEE